MFKYLIKYLLFKRGESFERFFCEGGTLLTIEWSETLGKTSYIDQISIQWFDTKQAAIDATKSAIKAELLEIKNGLLLLSGGSSASVAVEALSGVDTSNIEISQVDERYGAPGHTDSNWKLLVDSGLDISKYQNAYPVLDLPGNDLQSVGESYNSLLKDRISESQFTFGVLGMGGDGHISGMLPNTEQAFSMFLGDDYAASYVGPDFERLTTTAAAVQAMDSIILFASGPEKRAQLEKLSEEHPVHAQPAQILKSCKKVTIYYGEN